MGAVDEIIKANDVYFKAGYVERIIPEPKVVTVYAPPRREVIREIVEKPIVVEKEVPEEKKEALPVAAPPKIGTGWIIGGLAFIFTAVSIAKKRRKK